MERMLNLSILEPSGRMPRKVCCPLAYLSERMRNMATLIWTCIQKNVLLAPYLSGEDAERPPSLISTCTQEASCMRAYLSGEDVEHGHP